MEEVRKLEKAGIIKNTHKGLVDKRGYEVGFYRTRNKRYMEDKFVDMARALK